MAGTIITIFFVFTALVAIYGVIDMFNQLRKLK
jgi:hypothetical protein